MFRRLFMCAMSALLLAASPVAAQGRLVPYGPGAPVPLDRILPHIRSTHPGTFSDVDGPFADPTGRQHYRIKWLTPDGRVVWLDTDARTGRVLGVNHGWGGFGPYPRGYYARPPGMPDGPPPRYFRGPPGWGGWRGGGHFGLGGFRGGQGGGHGGHR
jgi:hypothetical protein